MVEDHYQAQDGYIAIYSPLCQFDVIFSEF